MSSNLSGGVLQAQETGAILSLLRAIDNARDDQAMLGALRSPAALCTAQDRAHPHPQRPAVCAAVAQFAQEGEGESADKVRAFWNRFAAWRALSRQETVDELLTDIFEQTDALSYYALQPGGAAGEGGKPAGVLRMSAQSFCDGDGSLYGFLQMLQLHQQLGVDEDACTAQGEDAVQLMTIHAQGPGVSGRSCRFCKSGFWFSSMPCLSKAASGVRTYDLSTRRRCRTACPQLAMRQKRQQELSEELRVFLWRLARTILSLTLIAQGAAEALAARAQIAPQDATCALDWLLSGARCAVRRAGHCVRCMGLTPLPTRAQGRWQIDIVPAHALWPRLHTPASAETKFLPDCETDADSFLRTRSSIGTRTRRRRIWRAKSA